MDSRRQAPPRCFPSVPALAALVAAALAALPAAADDRKVVVPFDFESKFDDGRYGQMVGDMIWKKLEREGGFIIPETMADVRDFCKANKVKLNGASSLEAVKKAVRDEFDAHIGIWGSVERVAGHEWDVYDLTIKCVDFSKYPDPKVIYEVTARTETVSEIPHKYVKEMLDKLYGREPGAPPPVDQMAEKNWAENPNLVVGDFEQGTGFPKGWESRGGQQREPLGGLVKWVPEPGNPKNKIIRLEFPASIGDAEGVMYYSDYFPVEEGAKYRFQCRWRTSGVNGKVFIKCGEPIETGYQAGYKPAPKPGSKAYRPEEGQMREVYRSQINLKGPAKTWNTHVEEFTPKHTKYTPRYGRVMLYGYLGGGWVEFDDIVLKQIVPPSPGDHEKDLRHSLETKVTLKEMEENERKSRELEEKQREQGGEEKPKPKAKSTRPRN